MDPAEVVGQHLMAGYRLPLELIYQETARVFSHVAQEFLTSRSLPSSDWFYLADLLFAAAREDPEATRAGDLALP